jgi:DNA-binding Lrp family transcriptional regulator
MSKTNIDQKLLALLQANARASITSLADQLGIARTTVQEHITRLERTGVISGYSVVLTRDPFQDYSRAIVSLGLTQRHQQKVIDRLRSYPEIKSCWSTSGEYDLFLIVEAPRLENIDELLDEISAIPGIEKNRSSIVLRSKFDRRHSERESRNNLTTSKSARVNGAAAAPHDSDQ